MRDRAADTAYRSRQASKGLRQLSVWVPGEIQVLLVELAAISRALPLAGSNRGAKSVKTLALQLEQIVIAYRTAPSAPQKVGDDPTA